MGKQVSILSITRDDLGNLQVKLNKDEMCKFKEFVKSIFDDNKNNSCGNNNGGCGNCGNMNQPYNNMPGMMPGMPPMPSPAAYVDKPTMNYGDQGMMPPMPPMPPMPMP